MKSNITKSVLNSLFFICFCYLVFLQYIQISKSTYPLAKQVFLLIVIVSLISFTYEANAVECSPTDCSLNRNKLLFKNGNGSVASVACNELERVNWRRAYLLSFVIFVVLNFVSSETIHINMIVLLFSWFILYWYFNFDTYHRFKVACDLGKK